LQAVEPKCEISVVLPEPHCGQCTAGFEPNGLAAPVLQAPEALVLGA
jgi:hypothetical protein